MTIASGPLSNSRLKLKSDGRRVEAIGVFFGRESRQVADFERKRQRPESDSIPEAYAIN